MENLCIFSQNAESANIGVVVPHLFLKYLICLNRILQYKMYTLIYYKWLKKNMTCSELSALESEHYWQPIHLVINHVY